MQDYKVTVTAESRDTGQTKTFTSTLASVGEMLNELVLSGYHIIDNMKISDI